MHLSAIALKKVTVLKSHPDNPRKHTKKQVGQIASSIKKFGFKFPVLVDADYQIIAGHGRVMAAKQLGMQTVPVIVADDLNETQVRALMIADNKLTENASWDSDLLSKNFMILDDLKLDFDLDITGFNYGEIESFINFDMDDDNKQIEKPPKLTKQSVSRIGDVWQLGEHRIICDNALDDESYALLMPTHEKAHLVFSDPPYNLPARTIGKVCESSHGNFSHGSGEMDRDEFIYFLSTVFSNCVEFSAEGSIHYHCMDWRHLDEIITAGKSCYTELKNVCVWTKDRAGMGSFYRSQHELVLVFKSGNAPHQNNFELGQYGRTRSNVWQYPSVRNFDEQSGDVKASEALEVHPTIKPVTLIEDTLKDCSRRHQIILDPFLGSGSTLIACENTQRICRGIEINPRYVDCAIERWQQWTGQEATCLTRQNKTFTTLKTQQLLGGQ